jgi:uncharacterized membrane protein
MDDQKTNREGGNDVDLTKAVKKQLVVIMSFGLAAMLGLADILHKSRSEDYEGIALMLLSLVLIPLWVCAGILALNDAVRTAFWLAITPIILAVILVVRAVLLG